MKNFINQFIPRNPEQMESIKEFKTYTYTSNVNGETIIFCGTIYAFDVEDAIYQAKKETSLSGYNQNEITIKFN